MQDSSTETFTIQGFTPYAQIPKWILRSGKNLSHGAKALYGVIMTYADNDTKAAFPGKELLAKDMGAGVRSIFTYMKELEDFGALQVTRRRNKRTGNFYANHYVLVFNDPSAVDCRPPAATDCPISKPTIQLDSPSSTSDAFASDKQTKPFTSDQGSDPRGSKNPGGLSQGQRKILRGQLVVIGKMLETGQKFYSDDVQDEWEVFIGMIEGAFPNDFDNHFADMLHNGKWTISAKVATPYGAGVEINKIINTALSQ